LLLLSLPLRTAQARSTSQTQYKNREEFTQYAEKLRESALLKMEPRVQVPTTGRSYRPPAPVSSAAARGRYPWKLNIVTTVFWVGEQPTARNPTPNHASSWDPKWVHSFGGYDN